MRGPALYIGLISGTSIDGIDCALVDFSAETPEVLATLSHPIKPKLKSQLIQLCSPGDNEIDSMGVLDRELGFEFAAATNNIIHNAGLSPADIRAIGCHGQTIRHRPPNSKEHGFTLQIGDPHTIAEKTGITTIADFRRADIAAGGHGAPLAPAFHREVFSATAKKRAIVNIGGISNITLLETGKPTKGYDTGPGNTLMDAWISQHQDKAFDKNGDWAKTGQIDETTLATLLADPYFSLAAPKSSGREYFNLAWLRKHLNQSEMQPADVQRTLLELTARTIANELKKEKDLNEIFICGGGSHNQLLMHRLQELLKPCLVTTTNELGVPPDWVEAVAFAWLAKKRIENCVIDMQATTGASRPLLYGTVFPRINPNQS